MILTSIVHGLGLDGKVLEMLVVGCFENLNLF